VRSGKRQSDETERCTARSRNAFPSAQRRNEPRRYSRNTQRRNDGDFHGRVERASHRRRDRSWNRRERGNAQRWKGRAFHRGRARSRERRDDGDCDGWRAIRRRTNDTKRRFGAPHVAVNPKNPDNIVVLASSNFGYTRACVPAPKGSDCEMISAGSPFLTQPRGFYKTPGFMDIGVFTSFDRGKTFKQIDVSMLVPPGHREVNAKGEGPIAATADGNFYIAFNAINWGQWETQPTTFFPNGGVGVIKSTDGGVTWNWVSYSGTPSDWPYGGSDLSSGAFYVSSGLAGLSTLGPRSTGLADSTEGKIADRWISSTPVAPRILS
jgi:hypothetical protein